MLSNPCVCMTDKRDYSIRQAIGRTQEVFESLVARRGERYACKVTTFVTCDKLFLHRQPSQEDHLAFCHALMSSMDITTPQQMHDFVNDAMIVRRAQELNL